MQDWASAKVFRGHLRSFTTSGFPQEQAAPPPAGAARCFCRVRGCTAHLWLPRPHCPAGACTRRGRVQTMQLSPCLWEPRDDRAS